MRDAYPWPASNGTSTTRQLGVWQACRLDQRRWHDIAAAAGHVTAADRARIHKDASALSRQQQQRRLTRATAC